jgi:LmbE family N-acetylglucosaminyl deacetylase
MKILAIGAHPDDIEFGMGGLMIKEAEKGSIIKYLVCSLGEAGSNGTPQGRKQEAQAAAKMIGAEIEFANFGGDCHITNSPANAIKIAGIIRKFKPNIILAPELQINQHPDHFTVAKLTQSACRLARYGGLKELKKMQVHTVDALYFYPSRAEAPEKINVVIDISDTKDKWEQTMSAHKSQMKTRGYHDLVFTKAAALGASVGVKLAIGLLSNDPIRVDNLSDLRLSSRNY